MICEIDRLVLRGVQFGVLFFLRIGVLFEVLMAVRTHLFKIDGRELGGMQFGGVGAGAVLRVTVHVCFCILTIGCTGAAVWGAGAGGVLGC